MDICPHVPILCCISLFPFPARMNNGTDRLKTERSALVRLPVHANAARTESFKQWVARRSGAARHRFVFRLRRPQYRT
jgi:hypothetical protein